MPHSNAQLDVRDRRRAPVDRRRHSAHPEPHHWMRRTHRSMLTEIETGLVV
jgi:hypothetical protein